MRRKILTVLMALGLAACAPYPGEDEADLEELASVSQSLQTSDLTFDVVLRTSGSARIHATVYDNEKLTSGKTVLAVHGMLGTGKQFDQLSKAAFSDKKLGKRVKRVVAIDMVGHGGSSYPLKLPAGAFGELAIEDNVDVLLQSIEALRSRKLAPQIVVGHSMGGLEIQAAQQTLLNRSSSLAALGVEKAILLAPVPPRGQPWVRPPSTDVTPYLKSDSQLGVYLAPPPFVGDPFTTFAGKVVPNAPTVEQVALRGYIGFEPLVTIAQLGGVALPTPGGGSAIRPLPAVAARAFAPERGTRLLLVSFSEDKLVPASNLGGLYSYLTGDKKQKHYAPVVAADAVHSMMISNPTGLIAAVHELL